MSTPLISVLIDTFNHEHYVEQAVTSAIEQDFGAADCEIVVVDDGSTDRTPEIVKKFGPRVRLINKKNGGQASAFNTALPELRGQLVSFLDGDDWWAKEKLTAIAKAFEAHPEAAGVGHGVYEYREDSGAAKACTPQNRRIRLDTPAEARDAYRNWLFAITSALTVRRELLQRVVPIPEDLVFCADAPIALAAMAQGIYLIEEPLCYYRQHRENLQFVNRSDLGKMRKRAEMNELTFRHGEALLARLGVAQDSIAALLYPEWVEASRFLLSEFGGGRMKTFRTEMRAFRVENSDPTLAYSVFKYLFVGAAALALPVKQFYRARQWYGEKSLGRLREQVARSR